MSISPKQNIKSAITELLHNKNLTKHNSYLLIKQTSKMIVKENLFLQLKQELHHHQHLNNKLKEYLNIVKEKRNLYQFNCNEAQQGCDKFKGEYKELVNIVDNYEESLYNLHKDRELSSRQHEEVVKMKLAMQKKLNKELISMQQKVSTQEKQMKNVLMQREQLILQKENDYNEYIKNDNKHDERYKLLQNKLDNLNNKSDRYFKKYQHVLDPCMFLGNEDAAQEMLSQENKEM
jgi:hypothetical protein